MIVELIVHSRAEMIGALEQLASDETPPATTICLWRDTGLTWFRFPSTFGRSGCVKRGRYWQDVDEFTPLESLTWRRLRVKKLIAAVRRIPEREFLA